MGRKTRQASIVAALGEKQLRLPCNLGYGRALQTGLKYSLRRGYDIVVSIDADGQHNPEDLPRLVAMLDESEADMVIGSRFCDGRRYKSPFGRRVGQLLFSHMTRVLIGQRIYDTTSGFKVLRAAACEAIVNGTFMDFHIETIVRLSLSGFKIVEMPIAQDRTLGRSMHSFTSVFRYPLQTVLSDDCSSGGCPSRPEDKMSTQGIILIDIVGLGLIVLLVNLVRTHKLHVGYGVIWLLAVLGLMITISFLPLMTLVTRTVGATYPASALSLLAFVFIFLMLIFFSVQLSLVSARQIELAQSQAIRELLAQEDQSQDRAAEQEPGRLTRDP
jgi:hypothetical protein